MGPTITRPSSGSNSPYPILKDSGGLNTFESAFAFRLECALVAFVQTEEENAKAGKGREDMMKLKSEQQLFYDAWGTPTGWADDPYSRGSSVASTPEYPASVGSTLSTSRTIDSHLGSPSTRASTFSSMNSDTPHHIPCALKRKVDDLDDVDELDDEMPCKKIRSNISPPLLETINELTPPSTPPSRDEPVAKSTGISSKDLAEAMAKASQRHHLGNGCAVQHRSSMSTPSRQSSRMQNFPP